MITFAKIYINIESICMNNKEITRILFICYGNICRSPMAEFVMKDKVRKAGLEEAFEIASAATSTEEIGNPVYPPVRDLLTAHGISCKGKTARQITKADYEHYDYIIAMDQMNLNHLRRFVGDDPQGKVHLLRSFSAHPGEIADPWFTRDFQTTWDQVEESCEGLLNQLR